MSNLYITYKDFISYGFNIETVKKWVVRKKVQVNHSYGNTSILYDSQPLKVRAQLPSKEILLLQYNRQKENETINYYYTKMIEAKENTSSSFLSIYIDKVKDEKLLEYSEKHAVLAYIMEDYERCKSNHERFNLNYYWQAFCKIYPGWYTYNLSVLL